jgi:hypothetical protein
MVKVLQQLLGRPVKWGLESRLRCFADIANRVITALLFGTKEAKITKALEHSGADEQFIVWNELGPVGKLHNICVTSTATMSAVESLDGVKLPSKVSSNWLSLTSFRTVVYDGTQLTI